MYTNTYKLSVIPGGVPLVIHISQYDVGLREYTFEPYTAAGTFERVVGAEVTLEATKPDGFAVIHECTYNNDGTITYALQEQLAAVPGDVWSKIVIRDGNDVLGTGTVVWAVDEAGLKDNSIISDSDISGAMGIIDAAVNAAIGDAVASILPTDTASGAMAHFEDGAENVPVKDLKVDIEPVQDLNGYDNPWPAGGGKNLLAPRQDGTSTNNGVTITAKDGVYALSGTSTAVWLFDHPINLPAGSYAYAMFNGAINGGSVYIMGTNNSVLANIPSTSANVTGTFTLTETATTLRIRGTSDKVIGSVTLSPMVVSGSTIPTSFEPYSNICPISGWTGATVTRAGNNLCFKLIPSANASATGLIQTSSYNLMVARVEQGKTYTASANDDTAWAYAFFTDEPYIGSISYNNSRTVQNPKADTKLTFVSPINGYVTFRMPSNGTTMQIEYGSTATTYEPYSGNTYNVSFGSAGTVYGGILDVTTGVLTVNKIGTTINALAWEYQGTWSRFRSVTLVGVIKAPETNSTPSGIMSDIYKSSIIQDQNNAIAVATTGNVFIYDHAYTDATQFVSARGNNKIVYELATPQTYNLTPTEVRTLLGANNIWADAGDSIVEYRADTALYIDKRTAST